jgi:DNA-binding NarL/FixJ family response regulator
MGTYAYRQIGSSANYIPSIDPIHSNPALDRDCNSFFNPEAKIMAGHYSIVLADAHSRFRREMRKILEEHPDLKVAGEAGNRQELFEILEQSTPSMVILDVSMPDLRAREGTRLIKMRYPEVKVLIMILDQEPEYFSHGLAAGAEGVLPKQYMAGQIFRAISVVRQGQVYIPPPIVGDSWTSAIRNGQVGFDDAR